MTQEPQAAQSTTKQEWCSSCEYSHKANHGHNGFVCECRCHYPHKQEWWEKEFQEKFEIIIGNGLTSGQINGRDGKDRNLDDVKSFISRTLAEERRRMLGDTQKILKELKLNFDAIVCECGEEWKDTDPAIFVEEKLNEIKQKLKE